MDQMSNFWRNWCLEEQRHSEIIKIPINPTLYEAFIVQAYNRNCEICINLFLRQINFNLEFVDSLDGISVEQRADLLARIENYSFYGSLMEHLKEISQGGRLNDLREIFFSESVVARNFSYQMALEKVILRGEDDTFLQLLQWEKERLAGNLDIKAIVKKELPLWLIQKNIEDFEPHLFICSMFYKEMQQFSLPVATSKPKKIKIKISSISHVYELLKDSEAWIFEPNEAKKMHYYKWNHFASERRLGYFFCFFLNYKSLMDFEEEDETGKTLFEHPLTQLEFPSLSPKILNENSRATGNSLLHWIVEGKMGNIKIIRFFIEEMKMDVMLRNNEGHTVLEHFIISKWSNREKRSTGRFYDHVLNYLAEKQSLDGADFIQKYSMIPGFLMIIEAVQMKILNQHTISDLVDMGRQAHNSNFMEYALDKFYGSQVNEYFPLIDRFMRYFSFNDHCTRMLEQDEETSLSAYYIVALLHSELVNDISTTPEIIRDILKQRQVSRRLIYTKEIYHEAFECDEKLEIYMEIFGKIQKFTSDAYTNPIWPFFPPFSHTKKRFEPELIQRMSRVFKDLPLDTLDQVAESIRQTSLDQLYRLVRKNKKKFREELFKSGLFSLLYASTCDWKLSFKPSDYEYMKLFKRKQTLHAPNSSYVTKGEIFPLKHLCRLEIREKFETISGGKFTEFRRLIEETDIPDVLKNYLLYEPKLE